jgi:CheY-like chemotaxis protein
MKKLNKILLIDDDQVTNYLNKELLKGLYIAEEVKVAVNGKLALEYMHENCGSVLKVCPELIILDHHMPVMDGMEFMQALNKIDFVNRAEVVFILLAIDSRKEDIEKFKRLGVQEFITKPLSQKTVMDAYNKYWSGYTAEEYI